MTGLSGTGKSTVARALAEATRAELHASDVVRKEIAHVAESTVADWGQGIYTDEWTDRTYRRLHDLAAESLVADRPVILDATYLETGRREDAAEVGRQFGVPVLLVETVCDERVVAERLAVRDARHDASSDARLGTFRRQRAEIKQSPPGIPASVPAIVVDTTERRPGLLDPVLTALVAAGAVVTRVP